MIAFVTVYFSVFNNVVVSVSFGLRPIISLQLHKRSNTHTLFLSLSQTHILCLYIGNAPQIQAQLQMCIYTKRQGTITLFPVPTNAEITNFITATKSSFMMQKSNLKTSTYNNGIFSYFFRFVPIRFVWFSLAWFVSGLFLSTSFLLFLFSSSTIVSFDIFAFTYLVFIFMRMKKNSHLICCCCCSQ